MFWDVWPEKLVSQMAIKTKGGTGSYKKVSFKSVLCIWARSSCNEWRSTPDQYCLGHTTPAEPLTPRLSLPPHAGQKDIFHLRCCAVDVSQQGRMSSCQPGRSGWLWQTCDRWDWFQCTCSREVKTWEKFKGMLPEIQNIAIEVKVMKLKIQIQWIYSKCMQNRLLQLAS